MFIAILLLSTSQIHSTLVSFLRKKGVAYPLIRDLIGLAYLTSFYAEAYETVLIEVSSAKGLL